MRDLIPLPYFNEVYIHVHSCAHMCGCMCVQGISLWYFKKFTYICVCVCIYILKKVVFFVIRVFFVFLLSFFKFCKNPKHYHIHDCLNNFIWLLLAAVCLMGDNVEVGCQKRKQLTFVSPSLPYSLPFHSSPFLPSLLQAFLVSLSLF